MHSYLLGSIVGFTTFVRAIPDRKRRCWGCQCRWQILGLYVGRILKRYLLSEAAQQTAIFWNLAIEFLQSTELRLTMLTSARIFQHSSIEGGILEIGTNRWFRLSVNNIDTYILVLFKLYVPITKLFCSMGIRPYLYVGIPFSSLPGVAGMVNIWGNS